MDTLQQKAIAVIKPLIPSDAEDRVARTVKQLNGAVRDHIRAETGLKLSDSQTRAAIPVKVTEGFPDKLAELIGRYNDPVLWRLIAAQPRLGGIVEGLQFLLTDWPAFERWPSLPEVARNSQPALERARGVALALQQVALSQKVKDELMAIDEDTMGTYSFPLGTSPWVELYWMPLALISAMLDVRIEDLTVVVLAHELAHGYTHQGKDIDGFSWDTAGFAKSDLGVVEGLAQFYADSVTTRMTARMPGANAAYKKLLKLQSGPYRVHENWLKGDPGQRGETVRFVMLEARNRGAVKYADWEIMLAETSTKLKRKGAAPKKGLFE